MNYLLDYRFIFLVKNPLSKQMIYIDMSGLSPLEFNYY